MSVYVDTSALAKCFVREALSLEVIDWADAQDELATSALTLLEFRCALARRRRATQIDAVLERRILAEFDSHMRGGIWRVHAVAVTDFADARDLIDLVSDIPLRALDALHLAVARTINASAFATADRAQAEAARALGFTVYSFSEKTS